MTFVPFVLIVVLTGTALSQERATSQPNLLQEAENLFRAHRYGDALQRYEQFLKTSPPVPQGQHAWLRTAEIHGIQGNWLEARSRYERLLAVKTDSGIAFRARYGMGQANYKLGNHLEAERNLENLSASSLPGDLRFKTHALLTELSLQAGNFTQAFRRLLLVEKDLSVGEEEWFRDLNLRLLSRASVPELEKLADLYRDSSLTAGVLLQLAKLEQQAGRPEKAANWLATLSQRFPESPEAAQAKELTRTMGISPDQAPPEVVGCLLPLSGEHSDAGSQVKNGLELAAAQSGVTLLIKDCGSDGTRTSAAVEELASHPQVLVLIGFFPTATADAAADTAQKLAIPLLALTQKKDITLSRNFVFRDFLTQRLMIQALLNYTANTLGWQRYAILYPNSKYGQSLFRQFSDEINRQAAKLVGQVSYPDGGQDVARAVATLQQISPGAEGLPSLDAIFVPDEANVVAVLAKEIASSPLGRIRVLGTNILHTPAALAFGEVLEGILFPEVFFAGDTDPAVKAFVADFRQRYQRPPEYLAAQGYSSLRLLAETKKAFPGLSRAEFAQRLARQTQPPGFSLFRGFNHEREAELPTVILTVRDRKFELEN